jgi:hypothetical protein
LPAPSLSAAVSAASPRGHTALAFVDVGVGFADRAVTVVAVGFLRIYGFCIRKTKEEMEGPTSSED